MAARYAAGFSVSGVNAANTQYANLNNTGTTQRIRVMQIAIGVASAPTTAPSFYLSRATARGTQSTSVTGNPFDGNDAAAIGTIDTAWSVAPTFSTTLQLTRGGLSTTAGGWWVWDFRDYPLIIPATAGAGICIVNASASGGTVGTFTGHFIWEE
jgi:hypothetical protein